MPINPFLRFSNTTHQFLIPYPSFLHLKPFYLQETIKTNRGVEMRTGATIQTTTKMTVAAATITSKVTFSPPTIIQHSPWHSPVPYLFGGLAAMLGLIAFALLVLACSYWKLSGHMNNGENVDRDVEAGEDKFENTDKALPVFEERIVVIMAGDLKPTFLATPMCSSAAFSFEDADSKREKVDEKSESTDQIQKPKEDMGTHEPTTTATTATKNRETNQNEASQEQNQ